MPTHCRMIWNLAGKKLFALFLNRQINFPPILPAIRYIINVCETNDFVKQHLCFPLPFPPLQPSLPAQCTSPDQCSRRRRWVTGWQIQSCPALWFLAPSVAPANTWTNNTAHNLLKEESEQKQTSNSQRMVLSVLTTSKEPCFNCFIVYNTDHM